MCIRDSLNTDTKQIKFGATYMTMNNTFYKAVNNEIENVVNNHGDVLYTRDPALDPKKQNEQIKDLVSLGIDVLIINPVESSSINKTLKEVKKAGIKIIVVDAPISDDQIAAVSYTHLDVYKRQLLYLRSLVMLYQLLYTQCLSQLLFQE